MQKTKNYSIKVALSVDKILNINKLALTITINKIGTIILGTI